MIKAKPRAGELTTANFGWVKPTVGASDDQWGSYINADLDGIDSTVHGIQASVPAASMTTPAMDGTAAVGVGTTWARADHVHPTDTSRAAKAGVTDGSSAVAGQIGEFLSVTRLVGAAMGVMTGVAKDVATLALTSGDWDVDANCYLTGATAGAVSGMNVWINTASATFPAPTANGVSNWAIGVASISNNSGGPLGRLRLNVTTTTTVYMSGIVNFSSGAASLYGAITARRMR